MLSIWSGLYQQLHLSGGSAGKESLCNAADLGSISRLERSPGEGKATHSNILAWRIPWTEDPGGLQSMGSQRVRHDWATFTFKMVKLVYEVSYTEFSSSILCYGHSILKWEVSFPCGSLSTFRLTLVASDTPPSLLLDGTVGWSRLSLCIFSAPDLKSAISQGFQVLFSEKLYWETRI